MKNSTDVAAVQRRSVASRRIPPGHNDSTRHRVISGGRSSHGRQPVPGRVVCSCRLEAAGVKVMTGVDVVTDDTLVSGSSAEEHDGRLRATPVRAGGSRWLARSWWCS